MPTEIVAADLVRYLIRVRKAEDWVEVNRHLSRRCKVMVPVVIQMVGIQVEIWETDFSIDAER